MDLLTILGALGSAASGGIFGLIGSGLGMWAKHAQRKAKWDNEVRMVELNMKVASHEGAWIGLSATHRAEAAINMQGTYSWVVAIKSLFRPVLTITLCLIAGWMFWMVSEGSLKDLLSVDELQSLTRYMINTVFFSASSAIMWWYGDRSLVPPGVKNR